ncbi:MAG: hypothetical protein ACOCV3_06330 [Halanaerobiales bacterium]
MINQKNNHKKEILFKIKKDVMNSVNDRLFGQFMEKASWVEPGPEGALCEETGQLLPEVVSL